MMMGSDGETLVAVAVLAKDAAATLPMYLRALEAQTFPAARTLLYVRTNDNADRTAELLEAWLEVNRSRYREVFFDKTDVDPGIRRYGKHEWNKNRFAVLGRIRQQSVDWARARGAHYFVADADNFVRPDCVERMLATGLPVVGPLLTRPGTRYANLHQSTTENGYYKQSAGYDAVVDRTVRGLIAVDVVHCTYLVRRDVLRHVRYLDGTDRHEYVVVAEGFRKAGIQQYVDNRGDPEHLTMATTEREVRADATLAAYLRENGYFPECAYLDIEAAAAEAVRVPANPVRWALVSNETKGETQGWSLKPGEKVLVIAPHAGMCNRFRALTAAVALGRRLGRKVYHAWRPEPNAARLDGHETNAVRDMQVLRLERLFEDTGIDPVPRGLRADVCFSEWGPGDHWFWSQSSAYRALGAPPLHVLKETAPRDLMECPADVVLLETSLAVRPPGTTEAAWERERGDAYRAHLSRPLAKYRVDDEKKGAVVGVALRTRATFARHNPGLPGEADLAAWLARTVSEDDDAFVTCDDPNARARILDRVPRLSLHEHDDDKESFLKDWERGFVDFLRLAACKRVYGTRNSSFAKEAALYGNRPYTAIEK